MRYSGRMTTPVVKITSFEVAEVQALLDAASPTWGTIDAETMVLTVTDAAAAQSALRARSAWFKAQSAGEPTYNRIGQAEAWSMEHLAGHIQNMSNLV